MKKLLSGIMMLATTLAAMTSLSSCEEEDDYIAQKLREGDWQGYIDTYYSSRWDLRGNTYATVMRFTSKGSYYTSGRGEEVDYDTRSPYNDYAYCTFKWFIVDGDITLIYDDDKWTPLYIVEYGLTESRFSGYIRDISNRRIRFDLENTTYNDWGRYGRIGGYGDFEHQNWYRSRTNMADTSEAVPFLDRTDIARQQSGEQDAVSVASGEFAKAMMVSEK
ncbi:MAG: hypothetical protein IJ892_14250 [Prevotella sp.]|nr:hypothetical protein [Prevotella sp.]